MLAWADKFKIEMTESSDPPTSWLYNLLRGAYVFDWFEDTVSQPFRDWFRNITLRFAARTQAARQTRRAGEKHRLRVAGAGVVPVARLLCRRRHHRRRRNVHGTCHRPADLGNIAWLGFLTLMRVASR